MTEVNTTVAPFRNGKHWRHLFANMLDMVPDVMRTGDVVDFVGLAVLAVLRVLVLSIVGALVAMIAPSIVLDAPETIGRYLASLCVAGQSCRFAEAYGGLTLAVFLSAGVCLTLMLFVRDTFEVREADGKDENIPDIVLDELDQAKRQGLWLTGADIARRTGLERLVVQQCIGCLIEDGKIERRDGGSQRSPLSVSSYQPVSISQQK